MAKIMKTRAQLEEMMMDEARKSGKCADLISIVISGPHIGRSANWDFGEYWEHGPTIGSSACRVELQMIVGRLQQQFDLSED